MIEMLVMVGPPVASAIAMLVLARKWGAMNRRWDQETNSVLSEWERQAVERRMEANRLEALAERERRRTMQNAGETS